MKGLPVNAVEWPSWQRDWRHEFPEVASASPELRKAVEAKWASEIVQATGRR
jgi:hypothetical protein